MIQIGPRIAIVSGYFNPLHVGHLRLMTEARKLADRLLVIVNNDRQQVEKKGAIIQSLHNRLEIVRSLAVVDEAIEAADTDATVRLTLAAIREKYPQAHLIFANGGDRSQPAEVAEHDVCAALGIELRFAVGGAHKTDSSSRINEATSVTGTPGTPSTPSTSPSDPRLHAWRQRLSSRTAEAVDTMTAVPGVVGVVLGGSVGRGEQWPLSDIDLIVVCADRPVADAAAEVDQQAYRLSEMWGTSGTYTAVDAGRLTFDAAEIRRAAGLDADETAGLLADHRWLHGLDKVYRGTAAHDPRGVAQELLDLSSRTRFDPAVVGHRTDTWLGHAGNALHDARQLTSTGDTTATWIAVRRAGTALAEAATERWGRRAGSLGRYWTHFEGRAERYGDPQFAATLVAAIHAEPAVFTTTNAVPEWLRERISLSYAARCLVGEPVSPEQNARDNVLAYTGLYRSRFPEAAHAWMRPSDDADPVASIDRLTALAGRLR